MKTRHNWVVLGLALMMAWPAFDAVAEQSSAPTLTWQRSQIDPAGFKGGLSFRLRSMRSGLDCSRSSAGRICSRTSRH